MSSQIPRPTRAGFSAIPGLDKAYLGEVKIKPKEEGGASYSGSGAMPAGIKVAGNEPVGDKVVDKMMGPGQASTKPKVKPAQLPPVPGNAMTVRAPKEAPATKGFDALEGGLADGKEDKDFDLKQIKAGTKVEREHTKDKRVAREISRDHLEEDPTYYTHLKKMESDVKKKTARKSLEAVNDLLASVCKAAPKFDTSDTQRAPTVVKPSSVAPKPAAAIKPPAPTGAESKPAAAPAGASVPKQAAVPKAPAVSAAAPMAMASSSGPQLAQAAAPKMSSSTGGGKESPPVPGVAGKGSDAVKMTGTTTPGVLHPGDSLSGGGKGKAAGKPGMGGVRRKPRTMGSAAAEGLGIGMAAAGDLQSPAGGAAPVSTGAQFVAGKVDTSTWGGVKSAGTKAGGQRPPSGISGTRGQTRPSGLSNVTRSLGDSLVAEFHKSIAGRSGGPALILRIKPQ